MTKREVFLFRALGLTALAALVLWGGQAYFDEASRLDSRFVSLQKEAGQMLGRIGTATELDAIPSSNLVIPELWSLGKLPEPLVLARVIKPELDRSGLTVLEFQVVSSTPETFTLKYSLEGSANAFWGAFLTLRAQDSHLIVKRIACTLKERSLYRWDWEVGYAVLP